MPGNEGVKPSNGINRLFVLAALLPFIQPLSGQIVFEDVGLSSNTTVICNTHGSGFFDYNHDGWDDIYVVHNTSLGPYQNLDNTLLRNRGNGTFENATQAAGAAGHQKWSAQGLATYEALRDVTRIDLLLCGHIHGEGRRTDIFAGHAIHTLLADYQFRDGGATGQYGDGWLRLLQFSPAQGTIHVRTWSVVYDTWETDADSDFVLPYDSPAPPFERIAARSGVAPGSAVDASWAGREPGRTYQWYAEADNCAYRRSSTSWTFRTR